MLPKEYIFETLSSLWLGVINVVPKVILAVLLFLIGWLIANLVEQGVRHLIDAIRLDKLLKQTELDDLLGKAGYKLNSGMFLGVILKWFVIILFLKLALGFVGLVQVDLFLDQVLIYLPSVIVAVLVLFVGSIVADAMSKIVTASAKAAGVGESVMIGSIARWVIWIFTIFIALTELQIGEQVVNTVLWGIIGMLALGGGIAIGLGAKDTVSNILSDAMGKKNKK